MANLAKAPELAGAAVSDPFDGTPYRLRRHLASGSMGDVFVVEHRQLGSQFVAKVLNEELLSDPQMVDRIRVEAQALGQLNHPNIVSIVGYGLSCDRRPFFVTEYLEGATLAELLSPGQPLPVLDALVFACQILWALAAAHSIGVIHRDIKPENLFLAERRGNSPQLKVLDFGIARVVPGISPAAPLPLVLPTDTGVIIGTPRYLSPEAGSGQHVDHLADIYSAGVVLYEMLTGRCPFDHLESAGEVIFAHISTEPEAPSAYLPAPLDPELDESVLKALRKEPGQRFQSAREFAEVLTSLVDRMIRRGEVGNRPSGLVETHHETKTRTVQSVSTLRLTAAGTTATLADTRPRRSWKPFLFVLVTLATAGLVLAIGIFGGFGLR